MTLQINKLLQLILLLLTLQIAFALSVTIPTSLNNSASNDHWVHLTRVLNEFTWPVHFEVLNALYQVVSRPQTYKLSPECRSSLDHFATGLINNRQDAFRRKLLYFVTYKFDSNLPFFISAGLLEQRSARVIFGRVR